MLVRLSIRHIVLIEQLDLDWALGLSVLTGETGAGKSILLDALTLALGGRGDAGLVRSGQTQGSVTAVFDIPVDHGARLFLRDQEIEADGDLILRRVQFADGRSKAFVNDAPVSMQLLSQLGAMLVEIHSQHETRALLGNGVHRQLLDAYGGLQPHVDEVRQAARQAKDLALRLSDEEDRLKVLAQEAEWLAHASEELEKLAPKAGEETALADQRQGMMQLEKVYTDLVEASEAIGGQASPMPHLSAVMRRLERRAGQANALVEPVLKALESSLLLLEEAQTGLDEALRAARFDPREMERIEERLFALRDAARKYNVLSDDLGAYAEKLRADLAAIEMGRAGVEALQQAVQEARSHYHALAVRLSQGRHDAALLLDQAVMAELPPLKLGQARFMTTLALDEQRESAFGYDDVEFVVQTNPGTKAGSMAKVASGGELSRFLLALKVVLAEKASAPTLIFDEIDTGVGGAVADAIGERLARLAKGVQVMCVTHAPQVAARADQHYKISKETSADAASTTTSVTHLDAPNSHEEVARMLAGAEITDEARAAAARLIRAAS
jgi:DNA repair protein RecN (Recombination protein N)